DRKRGAETVVGRVFPIRAGERDAHEVERLQVTRRRGELPVEITEGGRELVAADVEDGAIVGRGAAFGRDRGRARHDTIVVELGGASGAPPRPPLAARE